tara:strand:- start:9765 stop:10328 length:564 start_codon:yes stop_codon:yes gene_type:complete
MSAIIDYDNFLSFVNKMNSKSNDDGIISNYKDIYDGYTTYMVSKKYSNANIKIARMNSVINSYIEYSNIEYNRKLLENHYKTKYYDSFNMILNPPKCLFTAAAREKRINAENEKKEQETDDIKHHYDEINRMYKYYYELSLKKNDDKNENYEENFTEEDINEYYSTTDSDDYNYDSDNESDYYSDEN